jgi:CubicO group peptidase (beta-lactamase class C family)
MKRRNFLNIIILGGLGSSLHVEAEDSLGNLKISGELDPKFSSVLHEFIENFTDRGETNAQCTVYYKGRKVVDLWGRHGNKPKLTLCFSVSKGMSAAAMAVAYDRGLFKLNNKIADYWEGFDNNGKQSITVKQLLDHQAGLLTVSGKLRPSHMANHEIMKRVLQMERPLWTPGESHGYHLLTIGWYESQIIRSVDEKKRTLGKYFQEEIAKPLDIEFYIGLPDNINSNSINTVMGFTRADAIGNIDKLPRKLVVDSAFSWSPINKALSPLRITSTSMFNDRGYQKVEIPSANGIGTSDAVAKVYSELAGARIISKETLGEITGPITIPKNGIEDRVLRVPAHYCFGFSRPGPLLKFGSSSRSFGTPGLGGSFGMGDPEKDLGYAYITNELKVGLFGDVREESVRKEVYKCLEQ